MDDLLKKALKTTKLRGTGIGGSGCINTGECYDTDTGRVFIKQNPKAMARLMFDGEYASLSAILETNTVRVPRPIVVVDNPAGGAALAMEYVKMTSLAKHSAELGKRLANMHLDNEQKQLKSQSSSIHSSKEDFVELFGFHTTTCCGYLPLQNDWGSDWVEFFCRQRIDVQIRTAQEKYGDREAAQLWGLLQRSVPKMFEGLETIRPALLHGDLWAGNVAQTEDGPIIFDPATFYGHSEFDLSIAKLFGGFEGSFYKAYFGTIPKAEGFDRRLQLYQLFHYLNHWNHFGGSYRSSAIATMKRLVK
uniref:protein-ribulosamine 3-kinase n=1 Tax=Ornithodoros moubata TaxID=6938 RepID=A0A1Z5L5U7_ORNMO